MKFQNLSRALLLLTGGLGMTLGLTSCANDHTVGYVYVLGTTVNGQLSGTIGGLKEDNNNGNLTTISGGTVSSGGLNPLRAVVPAGNRFMYVLNAGQATADTSNLINSYPSANISLFTLGGFGQLSPQLTYPSVGYGSTRIAVNAAGTYLYVLDQYAPVGSSTAPISQIQNGPSATYPCQDPVHSDVYHPVGDIAVFSIDGPTGRLQVQPNARNTNLTYFSVGCNPTDFRLTASYLYVMDAGSAPSNDLQTVTVLAVNSANGQLTPTQIAPIQVTANNSTNITAINGDTGSKYIYLLDTLHNNIYAYTIGANGALTTINGSPFPSDAAVSGSPTGLGPIQSVTDSTGKYIYIANSNIITGNPSPTTPEADVSAYNVNASGGDLKTPVQNGGFTLGTVSSPVCIFEDPTNQYIYVAGAADNSITGRKIDPNTGTLTGLNKAVSFPTVGTPSWCIGISSAL